MKREILFRAKRSDDGEWVEGLLFYSHGLGVYKITKSNGWIPSYSNPDEGESTEYIDIIPDTICQFTGLTDNNGTKVFEGDVLKIHHNKEYMRPLTCEWDKDNSCFCYVDKEDFEQKYYLNISDLSMDEVIGNIYDNINLINK